MSNWPWLHHINFSYLTCKRKRNTVRWTATPSIAVFTGRLNHGCCQQEVRGHRPGATGQLDRRIFVDPDIYAEEQEKVFGRAWLMIGHESLVPKPNDFFHTYMGEEPVILTRDGKGELHAFLNMCRHRGNRVVRTDLGNAANFACAYHGWTFPTTADWSTCPARRRPTTEGWTAGHWG